MSRNAVAHEDRREHEDAEAEKYVRAAFDTVATVSVVVGIRVCDGPSSHCSPTFLRSQLQLPPVRLPAARAAAMFVWVP